MIELEELRLQAERDPAAAITAMRAWVTSRFTEFETERAAITAELDTLNRAAPPAPDDPALLDTIPHLTGYLATADPATQQRI